MRAPISISVFQAHNDNTENIYALCNDGTIWCSTWDKTWSPWMKQDLMPIPQPDEAHRLHPNSDALDDNLDAQARRLNAQMRDRSPNVGPCIKCGEFSTRLDVTENKVTCIHCGHFWRAL